MLGEFYIFFYYNIIFFWLGRCEIQLDIENKIVINIFLKDKEIYILWE